MRKKMKIGILLLILLSANTLKAQNNVIDQIIWVVGDEAILKSDVEKVRLNMLSKGQKLGGDPYCIIPEQLAIQKLFLDQAKIDSIEVSSGDIMRSVSQQEKNVINNIGSKEKVEEYFGTTMAKLRSDWKDDIRNDYLVSRVKSSLVEKKIKLTPSEVQKYYTQLPKDSLPYIPTTVEVQIISLEPKIPLTVADEVKGRLRDYTNKVNAGESFSTLALIHSEDPGSALNGGELGFMGRAELLPEFAQVAFSLSDPKKVSNIVETEYGYHILQLIERRGDLVNVRHILLRPRIPKEEIAKSMLRMDSILGQIKDGKATFELSASYYSFNKDTRSNNGLMVNKKDRYESSYGTSQFTMEDLPTEVGTAVKAMKVGDISAPFKMTESNGKEVVTIVKLRSRVEGHIANPSDDYQTLKTIVEGKKREELLSKWLQEKIKVTYVSINEQWRGCSFVQAGWLKGTTDK